MELMGDGLIAFLAAVGVSTILWLLAETLLRRAIADARAQGRRGLVLTCKEHLLHYYAKLGFVNEGVSGSVHGGAVWYQMRLTFENG